MRVVRGCGCGGILGCGVAGAALKIGRKSCFGFLTKILEKKTGNTGPGPLTSHVCGVQHIFWTRHVTS